MKMLVEQDLFGGMIQLTPRPEVSGFGTVEYVSNPSVVEAAPPLRYGKSFGYFY
jgi:hypothetical protein